MEKVEKVEKMKKAEISEKTKKVGVTEKKERVDKNVSLYQQRLARHLDELKWLYMELYDSQEHFDDLLKHLEQFYQERKPTLKKLDQTREKQPDWYRKNGMLGMMLYVWNSSQHWRNRNRRIRSSRLASATY